jgi:hypothetical protein
LSGPTPGFDETENGKSSLPKTIPCRSKTRVYSRLASTKAACV